jgi:hypothetical protein
MFDEATTVEFSPDGQTLVVSGTINVAGPYAYGTVAYDATGREMWSSNYFTEDADHIQGALAVAPDGKSVIVTGVGDNLATDTKTLTTVSYDLANGLMSWSSWYPSIGAGSAAGAWVAIGTSGRAYVAGDLLSETRSGTQDVVILAYDPIGLLGST